MRRFFAVAVAIALAASLGNNAWSQSGGGGGGAGGGAGASGGAAGAGASGATGGAGTQGVTGTPGASGSGFGAAGNTGATGSARAGVGTTGTANLNANATGGLGTNATAQMNRNFGGPSATPFFNDPGARQQLGLNNNQYNQLNAAYQQAYQRYNQNVAGLNTGAGTGGAATQRATRQQQAEASAGSNPAAANNNARANVATSNNRIADSTGREMTLQDYQNQFTTDFNTSVDATFTAPAMRQRYNQLNWQYQGVNAFSDPAIQQQLNLTPQQRQQFSQLQGQWQRDLRNLETGSRGNVTQQELQALRQRFATRVNSILTPAQQQQWTTAIGQPYEFPSSAYYPPNIPYQGQASAPAGVPQTGQRAVPQTGTNQNQAIPRRVR